MKDYFYKREIGPGYRWNVNQKFKYWIAPNVMLGMTPIDDKEGVIIHCERELTEEEKKRLDAIMADPAPALPPEKKGSIILVKDIDTWIDEIIRQTGMKLEYYVRKGEDGFDHLEVHIVDGDLKKAYQAFRDLVTIEK